MTRGSPAPSVEASTPINVAAVTSTPALADGILWRRYGLPFAIVAVAAAAIIVILSAVRARQEPPTLAARIDPGAGQTLSVSGAELLFPAGTFADETDVQVTTVQSESAPPPLEGNAAVSAVVEIEASSPIRAGAHAIVTLEYDLDRFPEGASEDHLYLASFDGELWQPVPNAVIDRDARTISAAVDHFSYWGSFVANAEAAIEKLGEMIADVIEPVPHFEDLPPDLLSDLELTYDRAAIKSAVYWQVSPASRLAATTLAAANFINQIAGAAIAAIDGGEAAVADWLAEELAKRLAREIIAEQTSSTTATFTVVLYDTAKLALQAKPLVEKGFKAVAKSAELQVEVAAWILDKQMNYINANVSGGLSGVTTLNLFGDERLEVYMISIDGPNRTTGRLDKGVRFYYKTSRGSHVVYFEDIASLTVANVQAELPPVAEAPPGEPEPAPEPVTAGVDAALSGATAGADEEQSLLGPPPDEPATPPPPDEPEPVDPATPPPTATPVPTAAPAPRYDFKTITDNLGVISVDIPSSWTVDTESIGDSLGMLSGIAATDDPDAIAGDGLGRSGVSGVTVVAIDYESVEPAARQEFGELLLDEMGGDCEVDGSWHATDFGLPIDTQIHHFGDCPEVGELLIFVTVIDDPAMFLAAYAFAPDGGEIELLKEILSSIRVAGSFSGVRP